MKKIMAVLTVLMCFASTNTFAQLKEVRGVQTRVVKYHVSPPLTYYKIEEIHGFEFKNENSYPVWVEVELCTNGYKQAHPTADRMVNAGTCDTKSFTLKAGETYIWKCGEKMIADAGIDSHDYYDQYYVKYKAYKAE